MSFKNRLKLSNGAATNSLLLTFVHVITVILGIVVTKLLSVHFSLEEYGTYSQAVLVTTTATSISILGLTNATNYFYNRSTNVSDQKTYVATIFAIQYIIGTLTGILLIVIRPLLSAYFGNDSLIAILPIVAFTPLLQNLISMYQFLFVSIGKAKVIAVRNLIVSSVRLLAVVLACFVFKNIVTVLIVILFLDMFQILYFFFLFKEFKHSIRIRDVRLKLTKEILIFSVPMSIYVLTNSLSRDIDKYVISAFSNTETLAVYTNAAKLLPFDMLTASLITVLIPIITRMINQKDFDKAQEVFKLYLRIGYVLTFIFVGGAIALSKNLMLFLYDDKYIIGLPVFVVYLVVDMIRFANVTTILSGAGKTKTLMVVSVSTMVLNAIFNVIGYKLFGLIGPAIVTLILTICMTIALLHFGAKEIRTKVVRLFCFREILTVGAQIIIMGAVVFVISRVLDSVGVQYVFSLCLCYGLYILVLGLLNYRRALDCYRKLNQYK